MEDTLAGFALSSGNSIKQLAVSDKRMAVEQAAMADVMHGSAAAPIGAAYMEVEVPFRFACVDPGAGAC